MSGPLEVDAVLSAWGLRASRDTDEDILEPHELVVQAAVYLSQAAGLKFGYDFGWPSYGFWPASNRLLADHYALLGEERWLDLAEVRGQPANPLKRADFYKPLCDLEFKLREDGARGTVHHVDYARVHFLLAGRGLGVDQAEDVAAAHGIGSERFARAILALMRAGLLADYKDPSAAERVARGKFEAALQEARKCQWEFGCSDTGTESIEPVGRFCLKHAARIREAARP